LANCSQIWQTAHRFGKFSIDFCLQSGESIFGEIEWQIFRQTLCANNFLLGKQSLVKFISGIDQIFLLPGFFLFCGTHRPCKPSGKRSSFEPYHSGISPRLACNQTQEQERT